MLIVSIINLDILTKHWEQFLKKNRNYISDRFHLHNYKHAKWIIKSIKIFDHCEQILHTFIH